MLPRILQTLGRWSSLEMVEMHSLPFEAPIQQAMEPATIALENVSSLCLERIACPSTSLPNLL